MERIILLRKNVCAAVTTGLALAATIVPAASVAQESATAERSEQAQLAEITVTAQKVQESTLDVPIAVSEISVATLQEFNIQTAADFAITVPNLSFEVSPFGTITNVVIRGVSGNNVTASYIDDAPAPEGLDPRLFDLASIEVLKGPQGTLYGEASMGGNIKYVTRQPALTGDNSGELMVQGGETSTADSPDYGGSASGNFVLIPDRVAARVSAVYQHDGGYTKDADPALIDDPAYVGFVPAKGWSAPGFMVNETGPNLPRVLVDKGDMDSIGMSASLRVAITDLLESTTGVIYQNMTLPNGPNNALASISDGYKPVSYTTVEPLYTPQFDQTILQMWYETLKYQGDGFTITSSTSHIFYWTNLSDDGSLPMYEYIHGYYGWNPNTSDLNPYTWTGINGSETWNEEARFAFDRVPGVKGLSGVVGLFGSFAHTNECLGGPSGDGGNTNQCIPEVDPGIAAQGIWPTDEEWLSGNSTETSEKAVFGELYYSPIKPLTLTVGLRYHWDYSDDHEWQGAGLDNNTPSQCVALGGTTAPPYTAAGGRCNEAAQVSSGSGLIPKVAISFKPTENQEIYAARSQGFRLGGPAPQVYSYCQTELAEAGETYPSQFTKPLQSDKLVSWELGYKAALMDQRLVLSTDAFDIEWTNKQQDVEIPICEISEEVNVGAARILGGEFELTGKPIRDVPLDVHLAAGVAHSYITNSGPASLVGAAPIGTELLDTPEWTGSIGVNYTFPIMAHHGFVNTSYSYTGAKESVLWSANNPIDLSGYGILNARLGIRIGANERTEISLFAKNLLNGKPSLGDYINGGYYTSQAINGKEYTEPTVVVEQPLTVGLQLRTKF
jgi:iron complex outermembrane recepter protein